MTAILGTLLTDPDHWTTCGGTAIALLTITTSRPNPTGSAVPQGVPLLIRCIAWRHHAAAARALRRGTRVLATGAAGQQAVVSLDGSRSTLVVHVTDYLGLFPQRGGADEIQTGGAP